MFDRICIYETLFTKARRNKYDFSRFQYFLLGFSTFDVLPSALAPFFFSLFQSRCLFNCFQKRDPRWLLSPFAFSRDFNEMEINPFGESVSFLVRGNRVITCGAAVQQRVTMDDYTHHPRDLFPCAVPSGNRRTRTQQKLLVSGCKLISQWKRLRIGASARQIDINGVGCETSVNYHASEYGKVGPLL